MRPSVLVAQMVTSSGISRPSLRLPASSTGAPMTCASPVVRKRFSPAWWASANRSGMIVSTSDSPRTSSLAHPNIASARVFQAVMQPCSLMVT
jgi:hypothetical protein